MKRILIALFFFILLFSCNSKKKYEGKWADIYYSNPEKPEVVIIENDSIKFNYLYFDHWHKYSLTINGNQLAFDSFEVKTQFKKDTLILNHKNFYIHEKDSLFDWVINKHLLSIDLPEIKNVKSHKNTFDPLTYVHFGKRLDNDKFSLQLNDKLTTNFNDLRSFLSLEHASLREELVPSNTLRVYIDKNTPMRFLEEFIYHSSIMNQLKIEFINSLDLNVNYDFGIYYKNTSLKKHLPHLGNLNESYFSSLYGFLLPPPPPPPYNSPFENELTSIVFLINNEIYYNQDKISLSELKIIAEETIKNNDVIISLYDLNSNYSSFLELIAEIDSAYYKKRNKIAIDEFNKPLDSLEREDVMSVKWKIPQKHIWSYSIPHYQSFVKDKKEFMGLNVKSIDSLLPKFYLDSASSAE